MSSAVDASDLNSLDDCLMHLNALTEGLENVRPNMPSASAVCVSSNIGQPTNASHSSSQLPFSSARNGAVAGVPVAPEQPVTNISRPAVPAKPPKLAPPVACKPAVAPKPKLDSYQYSMKNLEQSLDVDLDALIGELCELEAMLQCSSTASLFSGFSANSGHRSTSTELRGGFLNVNQKKPDFVSSVNRSAFPLATSSTLPKFDVKETLEFSYHHQQQLHDGECGGFNGLLKDKNQLIVDTCERQNGLVRAQSPDNDSAFCDTSSMLSMESVPLSASHSNDSNGSCEEVDRSRGLDATPSPTHVHLNRPVQTQLRPESNEESEELTEEEKLAKLKSEKIKLALEKMKEASIKKIFTKIYADDGSSKSIMVNEKMNVGDVLCILADKFQTALTLNLCIVEQCVDLHMERIYEDHENLVENVLMWTRDSANKIVFTERPEKYVFLSSPQLYLLSPSAVGSSTVLEANQKRQIVEEFFSLSNVQPPDIEGMLYLKTDGKKAWKKHMFVLRASGIYYVAKGKTKTSKDLQCLMRLDTGQCYVGVGWKKKYKAPTEFGFAVKHPRIQVKASKYIKYLCADDDATLNRWLTGIRVAINGQQLLTNHDNCKQLIADMAATPVDSRTNVDSSCSDTFCHESIVMRPASAKNGAREAKHVIVCTGLNDSQSCASLSCSGGRNSANSQRTKIDRTPSLSSADSELSNTTTLCATVLEQQNSMVSNKFHPLPEMMSSQKTTAKSQYSSGDLAEASSAALLDSVCLINAFESDSVGTIKKRPSPSVCSDSLSAVSATPLSRLNTVHFGLLTDTTRHIHSVIQGMKHSDESLSCSTASLPQSFDGSLQYGAANDDAEIDSDEEFPPPPPEVDVCLVGADCDSPASSFHGNDAQDGSEAVLSPPVISQHDQSSVFEVRMRNNSQSQELSVCDYASDPPTGARKAKPPPPKRSQNTRLSTFSTSSAEGCRSPDAAGPVVAMYPEANGTLPTVPCSSSGSSAPAVKPKPVVPVKPKMLLSSKEVTESATPAGPTTSNPLMSDLQKAMQKRLQKIEADTAALQKNAASDLQ